LLLDENEYNEIIMVAEDNNKSAINSVLEKIAYNKNRKIYPLSDSEYTEYISKISAASINKDIQKQIVDLFITRVMRRSDGGGKRHTIRRTIKRCYNRTHKK
jgi:hypothetical protein